MMLQGVLHLIQIVNNDEEINNPHPSMSKSWVVCFRDVSLTWMSIRTSYGFNVLDEEYASGRVIEMTVEHDVVFKLQLSDTMRSSKALFLAVRDDFFRHLSVKSVLHAIYLSLIKLSSFSIQKHLIRRRAYQLSIERINHSTSQSRIMREVSPICRDNGRANR